MPKKKATKSNKTEGPTFERVEASALAKPSALAGLGPSAHLRSLEAIPDDANTDPVGWADKHLEKLVPLAAKEKEWQLKFGTDATRDKVASELLAMRSISAKKEAGMNVAAVINLVPFQNPWAKSKELPADQRTGGPAREAVVDATVLDHEGTNEA